MCIYVVCRRNRDQLGLSNRRALAASTIRAIVLAPARYYGRDRVIERLRIQEPQIRDGLHALVSVGESFSLDFAFQRFPQSFDWNHATTTDDAVIAAMTNLEPAVAVRPGTESPVQVACSKCSHVVPILIGETEGCCSNCETWVRR